jgi:ornithine carbamoyltransferase
LIEYDQNKAFENADFIYTKTGVVTATMENYQFRSKLDRTAEKMKLTNNAKFMHCLPVRRNVTDEVLTAKIHLSSNRQTTEPTQPNWFQQKNGDKNCATS